MKLWRVEGLLRLDKQREGAWVEWMVLADTKEHALAAVEKETRQCANVTAHELDAMTLSGPKFL